MADKDTLKDAPKSAEEMQNDALVQEMLRGAQPAKVESELEKNPVIHRGDGDQPAPMVVNKIANSGYVWIYDSRTGEQIPCVYYLVPSKLRQKRQDGSFRFTTVDPGFRPKKGNWKCMLHPDSENRAHYDELGFRVCNKSNITNKYQLIQHMKKKHKEEWAAIEAERIEKERQEDRALQRLLLANAANKLEQTGGAVVTEQEPESSSSTEAPLYVSDKPKVDKPKTKRTK